MARKKTAKKMRKDKGAKDWSCNNPGKPYDLATLLDMLEKEPGFATFLFPVVQGALAYNAADIDCLQSYLAPLDPELSGLGVPSWNLGSTRRCTDVSLLVAVTAQKYA